MDSTATQPLISVIVPIYNVEKYLPKCIESIINQTYTNLEIILVDDGSPDNCGLICDEYAQKDNRIKVVHKTNGGVSSARNTGLDIANGEWIAFVDSDDFIDNNYCQEFIIHQEQADIIMSDSEQYSGLHLINDIKENYYSYQTLQQPVRKIYKSEIISNIRFDENLNCGEDIIFNLALLQNIEKIFCISYDGYHINYNPTSITRQRLNKYDFRLDEEYQRYWGGILDPALEKAGISKKAIQAHSNSCSIWIYQKIKNYCFDDCPHKFKEKLYRIKCQLQNNRSTILSIKYSASPKTHFIVKLFVLLKSPFWAYIILKLLIKIGL